MSLVQTSSIYWQGRRDRHAGTYRPDCVPREARVHYNRGWSDGADDCIDCEER